MSKILKPQTIIPQELYVERSADKQLAEIINDMGRPGYILVARQMGKTNLLINAKRTLEGENDIFSYVDLSNKFDSARECFRNIIDVIIESNTQKLDDVSEKIYKKRRDPLLPSHKEHSYELRLILGEIKGKLVINLDEIDSLTVADYSDKIFAQIRSIYFERINVREFDRLSYILSGVAEPSDIIKDRSISPFNIGQKIFLGDFNYKEFCTFLKQANLDLSDLVKDRIFYWVNGNPRLTWEICSEIEDVLDRDLLATSDVDLIVENLYLKNFDKPPVDHIRSLIESRKDLRQGVISINYGKESSLTDKVKNRLYLAGILDSNYEEGKVKIKNKIIERALDDKWLEEIENEESSSIVIANNYFAENKFDQAAIVFSEVLDDESLSEARKLSIQNKLGVCYYELRDSIKAIKYLRESLYDKDAYRASYTMQVYLIATSYYHLAQFNDAKKLFEEIIEFGYQEKYFFEAQISLAGILHVEDTGYERDRILELNNNIINNCDEEKLVAIAYGILGAIEEKEGKMNAAFDFYMKSVEKAKEQNKVKPLLAALRVNKGDGENIFIRIVDILEFIESDLLDSPPNSIIEFDRNTLRSIIIIGVEKKFFKSIELLLENISKRLKGNSFGLSELILELALKELFSSNTESSIYLFDLLSKMDRSFLAAETSFLTSKYLSLLVPSNSSANMNYFKGYQNYVEAPDTIDILLFEREITSYLNQKEYVKSRLLADRFMSQNDTSPSSKLNMLPISFLKMKSIENKSEKLEYAKVIKRTLKVVKVSDLRVSYLDEQKINVMKLDTLKIIEELLPKNNQSNSVKKYGRNDLIKVRYFNDGKIIMRKYKLLCEDIQDGLCSVIND